MRKYYISILIYGFISGLVFYSQAQTLSLHDLKQIQSNKLDMVRSLMIRNGWTFHSAEIDVFDILDHHLPYEKIAWYYGKNQADEEWLYLLRKEGFKHIVVYQINQEAFLKLEEEVRSNVTVSETKVRHDKLITSYLDSLGIEFQFVEFSEQDLFHTVGTKYSLILSDRQSVIQHIQQNEEMEKLDENPLQGGPGTGVFDGTGDGIFGRQPISGKIHPDLMQQNGRITFKVCIDRRGRNTYTKIIQNETTIKDRRLQKMAIDNMSRYLWEEDYSAPKEQCGKYTFSFKLSN